MVAHIAQPLRRFWVVSHIISHNTQNIVLVLFYSEFLTTIILLFFTGNLNSIKDTVLLVHTGYQPIVDFFFFKFTVISHYWVFNCTSSFPLVLHLDYLCCHLTQLKQLLLIILSKSQSPFFIMYIMLWCLKSLKMTDSSHLFY